MEGSANSDGPAHVEASVLTPVLNEERHISDTVAAMQAQRFDGEVEFLFMDGRSEDRTKEILEELAQSDPRIRIFDNPGRSSTAGLNVGLRHARGDYLVRMDAHTFYPDDYIARGVGRLRKGDVVWVAGPQVPFGTDKWSRRVALALRQLPREDRLPPPVEPRTAPAVPAGARSGGPGRPRGPGTAAQARPAGGRRIPCGRRGDVSADGTRGGSRRRRRPSRCLRRHAPRVGFRVPLRVRAVRAAARRGRAGARAAPPVKLLVYTDYVYTREGETVYAERAFALFLAELRRHIERLVIIGRLDPSSGVSHYRLPADVEFVPLPHYSSLVNARESAPAMLRSLARFWRALRDVDTVWLLGPYALSVLFAGLAAVRGRSVALGVRQDQPAYVRSRHPGRRWL